MSECFSLSSTEMHKSLLSIDSKDRDIVAYPRPNRYRIDFPKLSNVKSVKLVSTEIPNCSENVKESNNEIVWRVRNEPLNTAVLPKGNYTYASLTRKIRAILEDASKAGREFDVVSDPTSDTLRISQYELTVLSNPVSTIDNSREIFIDFAKHGLSVGDQVSISEAKSVGGLSCDMINNTHEVLTVSDNGFSVSVQKAATSSVIAKGGTRVKIGKPVEFQFLFDRPHSLGKLLGFAPLSTAFQTSHTNSDRLDLSGDRYCLLKIPQLGNPLITSTGEKAFAQLFLQAPPGAIVFNSFQAVPCHFDTSAELDHLDIEITAQDGSETEFKGIDHSLLLEITH